MYFDATVKSPGNMIVAEEGKYRAMKKFYLKDFTCAETIPVSVRNSPHGENTDPHTHDYVEIVFIRAGHAIHSLHSPDGTLQLSNSIIKGDVFTVLPGEVHSYSDSRMFRNYNLCVGRTLLDEMTEELQTLAYFDSFFSWDREMRINQLHLTPMDFLAAENLIKKLVLVLHGDPQARSRRTAVKLLLMELFLQIFDGVFNGWKQMPGRVSEKLFLSIQKLEAHPEEKVQLAKIARGIGMSLSSYAHKFTETVGVSPTEYLNLLRLENAKKQLEDNDLSLFEIAVANGFGGDNYFIRMFKKRYGITPKRYRMLCARPALPS